jgi:D-beta-D-heptose 7-phosphate kinase/D-beta-D-heptose 1-phosphate adenosyltransferase
MIGVEQAEALIHRFRDQTVLVVGDLMLDRYVAGTVSRISPEAPVPVVWVTQEYARPGGAANVALNIQALGGRAVVCGVVGRDAHGEELLGILRRHGIGVDGVVARSDVRTIVKTRIVADRQQVVRVDREDAAERMGGAAAELAGVTRRLCSAASGVIIEDYGKGAVDQGVVDAVMESATARGAKVGLDPKDNHALRLSGITLATPNFKEACLAAGLAEGPLKGDLAAHPILARAGDILLERWRPELLIITLGPHGMYLRRRGAAPLIIPTVAREVYDVCGAGDTVIATALLGLAAGATHEEAASLANCAAGVVVGKVGTATCSVAELRASVRLLSEGGGPGG